MRKSIAPLSTLPVIRLIAVDPATLIHYEVEFPPQLRIFFQS